MFKGGTALAVLALLVVAPGAQAELGAPFAETGAACLGGDQTYHKLSDVLTMEHPHVAARYSTEQSIELGPLPKPPGVDNNSSIGPGVMWWPGHRAYAAGTQITQAEECYATQHEVQFSSSILYYDMPTPPLTYSETTGGRGYFPFLLSKRNSFVADVTVWQGSLKLEQPDTSDGMGGPNGTPGGCCHTVPDAWQRTLTGGDPPVTATIDLGSLGAGEHTLAYTFRAGWPSPRYAVRIRSKDTPKPPGPVEPTPTPTTPTTPSLLPEPGPPATGGAPGTPAPEPVPLVAPQSVPRIAVLPGGPVSGGGDRTKPRLNVRITGEGRFRRVRVRALTERTSVRLTIRKGNLTRKVSGTLGKGRSLSLRTRWRGARITVTGRDRAGNVATMRRALQP